MVENGACCSDKNVKILVVINESVDKGVRKNGEQFSCQLHKKLDRETRVLCKSSASNFSDAI